MIRSKKIAIFGFGKEGVSAANYLGHRNQITIFEKKQETQIDKSLFKKLKVKGVNFYFGDSFDKNLEFDLIIRSPGVRPENKYILFLERKGAKVTSSTKIFFLYCPCKIIGVTGTKGKGTTSTLIYKFLKTKYKDVFLAGNIGTPMLQILPKLKKDSLVILELSSFQLIDLDFSPYIAVILMITTEHLDWHKDQKEYYRAKESIVSHQTGSDYAIINFDYEKSRQFAKKTKAHTYFFSTRARTNGVYVEGDNLISEIGQKEIICKTSKILLPGRHNLQNVAAAVCVAKIFDVNRSKTFKIVSTFKGLKHRLQLVGEINGVKYYNDSFSTIPETAVAAIESFSQPKILILGGSSKNSDFSTLAKKISKDKTLKALILIGSEAKTIKNAIIEAGGFQGNVIQNPKDMKEIVESAANFASWGDVVILSPACASFDMFKNYQDRGQKFTHEVQKLNKKPQREK